MSSSSRAKHVVRAAGALVWRERRGRLEVLLVHRPRYDDWSFPKGKVEPGESVRTCAVREVAEETGARIALGQPLETIRYKLSDGRRKRRAGRASSSHILEAARFMTTHGHFCKRYHILQEHRRLASAITLAERGVAA